MFPAADIVWLPCWPLQAALGEQGAVAGVSAGKGYVDMSTVDEATSKQIAAAVAAKVGRFLEVGAAHWGGQCNAAFSHIDAMLINTMQLNASAVVYCICACRLCSLLLPKSLTLVAGLWLPPLPAAPAGTRVWQQEASH